MCLSAYTSVYASVCIHISQFITNRKYCPAYEEACVRARVRDISLTHTHTHTSHSDLKVEIDKPENQAAAVATAGSYMTGSVQAKPLIKNPKLWARYSLQAALRYMQTQRHAPQIPAIHTPHRVCMCVCVCVCVCVCTGYRSDIELRYRYDVELTKEMMQTHSVQPHRQPMPMPPN